MQNMNIMHIISNDKPNAELVEMNMNQQAEWMSWWLSNSVFNVCSALNARIVDSPLNVAAKCVKTGDFAVKIIYLSMSK